MLCHRTATVRQDTVQQDEVCCQHMQRYGIRTHDRMVQGRGMTSPRVGSTYDIGQ